MHQQRSSILLAALSHHGGSWYDGCGGGGISSIDLMAAKALVAKMADIKP